MPEKPDHVYVTVNEHPPLSVIVVVAVVDAGFSAFAGTATATASMSMSEVASNQRRMS